MKLNNSLGKNHHDSLVKSTKTFWNIQKDMLITILEHNFFLNIIFNYVKKSIATINNYAMFDDNGKSLSKW